MVFRIFYQVNLTGSGLFKIRLVQKWVINLIKNKWIINLIKNAQKNHFLLLENFKNTSRAGDPEAGS